MTKKQKNILLIVGFLLALIICYKLAISKTIYQKNLCNNLKQEALLLNNAPKKRSILNQKEVYFDSILNKYQLDGSSIQNNLLKTINTFADNKGLKVISFLEPHIFVQNDLTIKTYEIVLQGDYNSIINLIHELEQQSKMGEIINLHFEKKKNFKNGKHYLQTRVLLKSFSSS